MRAFVAREGALIASALDRAARALQASPGDREPLYTVIRRMQSLRGLAELSELVPLPEILDGIELAVGDLTRLFAPPPGVDEVIAAGSIALTRISRDIAEHGRPEAETEEARRFTELLLRAFAVERDVVPIESLYFDGRSRAADAAARRSRSSPPPAPLGPLELVSHGEHLCQSADLIAALPIGRSSAISGCYHLLGTLRAAGTPGPDPVAGALVVFARSAREALAAGVAARADARAGELPARGGRAAARGRRRRRPDAHLPAHPGRRLSARRPPPGRGRPGSRRRCRHPPLHLSRPPAPVRSCRSCPIESLLYDERCPSSR